MAVMLMDDDLLANVIDGKKTSTIRRTNKEGIECGHSIMLVSEKHKAIVRVKTIRKVAITKDDRGLVRVSVDGYVLPTMSARRLAVADGFKSVTEMVAWFDRHGYAVPFSGVLFEFGKEVRECK